MIKKHSLFVLYNALVNSIKSAQLYPHETVVYFATASCRQECIVSYTICIGYSLKRKDYIRFRANGIERKICHHRALELLMNDM